MAAAGPRVFEGGGFDRFAIFPCPIPLEPTRWIEPSALSFGICQGSLAKPCPRVSRIAKPMDEALGCLTSGFWVKAKTAYFTSRIPASAVAIPKGGARLKRGIRGVLYAPLALGGYALTTGG
jgi:hypothetical protein